MHDNTVPPHNPDDQPGVGRHCPVPDLPDLADRCPRCGQYTVPHRRRLDPDLPAMAFATHRCQRCNTAWHTTWVDVHPNPHSDPQQGAGR